MESRVTMPPVRFRRPQRFLISNDIREREHGTKAVFAATSKGPRTMQQVHTKMPVFLHLQEAASAHVGYFYF